MERIRTCSHRGYSLSIDERFDGASGVAVPIIDGSGLPRAALNMVMLTPRFFKRKEVIIQEVKKSVKSIENTLFDKQENNNIRQLEVR
jgi:DNA-binding IclR family transcriptional regulator